MDDRNLLSLFIVNFILVIADASVGYRFAPFFVRCLAGDESEAGAAGVRRTLTLVVALYMFFNCLAWRSGNMAFLATVNAVIMADMCGQIYLRVRLGRRMQQ